MNRGSVKKKDSVLITFWAPNRLLPLIAKGVEIEDSDRSKFIRNAIRDKLAGQGIPRETLAQLPDV